MEKYLPMVVSLLNYFIYWLVSACNSMLEKHGNTLARIITESFQHEGPCESAGLCPNSRYCSICESVLQWIDSISIADTTHSQVLKSMQV